MPREDSELLDSIRAGGQQVPVVARPSVCNGRFEVIVGTRRIAAIREINKSGGELKIVAEVRQLEDDEAWLLAETENVGRKAVSPLAQARSWAHACRSFYSGSQADMARALGVDKSVVSRSLALAQLPDVVIDLVKNRDSINLHFAAQLTPLLNDVETSGALLALAQSLVDQGIKLSPAEAVRRLVLDRRRPTLRGRKPFMPATPASVLGWSIRKGAVSSSFGVCQLGSSNPTARRF